MKNTLLILTSIVALAACTPSADTMNFPVMPPEMQDCKVFRIDNGSGTAIVAVRCPNSTTTSKNGKQLPTAVLDGATYQKVEE